MYLKEPIIEIGPQGSLLVLYKFNNIKQQSGILNKKLLCRTFLKIFLGNCRFLILECCIEKSENN